MKVTIHEVGPRDGLQNESEVVSTEDKLAFIESLVASGLTDIEVTSFVRPRWVPQLADAVELVRRLPEAPGVTWWALVPNRIGMERALEAGIPGVDLHVFFGDSQQEEHQPDNPRVARDTERGDRHQCRGGPPSSSLSVHCFRVSLRRGRRSGSRG